MRGGEGGGTTSARRQDGRQDDWYGENQRMRVLGRPQKPSPVCSEGVGTCAVLRGSIERGGGVDGRRKSSTNDS